MKYSDHIKKKHHLSQSLRINDYLSIKNNRLFYEDIDLVELTEKNGAPLEVAFTETIKKRIVALKKNFAKAISNTGYQGKFIYAYTTKANYYSEVVTTALSEVEYIETTSSYDLDIIESLEKRGIFDLCRHKIICNGFKFGRYMEKIIKLRKLGYDIIPVLENLDELVDLMRRSDVEFEIGVRFQISDKTKIVTDHRLSSKCDSRFGMSVEEIESLVKQIETCPHLKLQILHFHLGGTIIDIKSFCRLVTKSAKLFCKLKKKCSSLSTLDIGGGLPVQYDLDFKFDYQDFANQVVNSVKRVCRKNKMPHPDIIGEYGRYTVNDHGMLIFKVITQKKTDNDANWYLINGSLMNCLPDSWALGQDFVILPLNGWDRETKKIKLGGITCDPDDTYFKNGRSNYLCLPELKEGEDLYIGFFGTGAYQEMISGVGGVHHCLLPEGNEVIIYEKNGARAIEKISKIQSPDQILSILDYHRHHRLERYL